MIDNLYVERSCLAVRPFEADPPLLVDADRELPRPLAFQGLNSIARQGPQRIERGRRVQDGQPLRGLLLESLKCPDKFALAEFFCPFVPVAADHPDIRLAWIDVIRQASSKWIATSAMRLFQTSDGAFPGYERRMLSAAGLPASRLPARPLVAE